ncbi:hypothetical protein N0V93_002608 [Gnomoniopsis smithogilvyi]|uniref:Uncharacterized protein n=1 Tax=Gnomoniopsis smithogilvyi TaxID=1191159 RepID=A0A9W8YX09_9PEZI|nr:hypothetical protein N0V93_002608 [Gnomoniopsis smithogilvyi]
MSTSSSSTKDLESTMAKMTIQGPDSRLLHAPEARTNTRGISIRDFAVPATAPESIPLIVITDTKNQDTIMEASLPMYNGSQ